MSKVFMERLREIMEIRGRTGQELADATGLDRKMIVRMRMEPDYDPRLSVVEKLAADMDVPVTWLLGWDGGKETVIEVPVEVEVEKPVEVVRVVRRKFFNPKWEED